MPPEICCCVIRSMDIVDRLALYVNAGKCTYLAYTQDPIFVQTRHSTEKTHAVPFDTAHAPNVMSMLRIVEASSGVPMTGI